MQEFEIETADDFDIVVKSLKNFLNDNMKKMSRRDFVQCHNFVCSLDWISYNTIFKQK